MPVKRVKQQFTPREYIIGSILSKINVWNFEIWEVKDSYIFPVLFLVLDANIYIFLNTQETFARRPHMS